MAVHECFLCNSKLIKVKHPANTASAKLYLQTLSELLSFEGYHFGVAAPPPARQTRVTKKERIDDWRNILNNEPVSQVDGKSLVVVYCEACVQVISQIINTYKQFEKIQQQIFQLKNQILKQWKQIFINDQWQDLPRQERSLNTLRCEVVQGINLQNYIRTNNSQNAKIKRNRNHTNRTSSGVTDSCLTTKIPLVQLTRIEDIPALSKYSQMIAKVNECQASTNNSNTQVTQNIEKRPHLYMSSVDPHEIFNVNDETMIDIKSFDNSRFDKEIQEDSTLNISDNDDNDDQILDDVTAPDSDPDYEIPTLSKIPKKLISPANRRKKKIQCSDESENVDKDMTYPKSSKSNIFYCGIGSCDFSSEIKSLTDSHINEVHKGTNGQFKCNLCSTQNFSIIASLKYHLNKYHGIASQFNKFQCPDCKTSFPKLSQLNRHKFKVHDPNKVRCTVCSISFRDNNTLGAHMTSKHKEDNPYICPQCGLIFKTSQYLKYHQNAKHSVDNKYQCEICNKLFGNPINLRNHIVTQHQNQYRFRCEICGKGFISPSALQRHMVWHNDERNFECDICHTKYKTKIQLQIHTRRHTGDFNFRCDICSKNFLTPSTLRRHAAIHGNVLKHFCQVCGKGFPIRNYLTTHMYSHATPEQKAERKKNKRTLTPMELIYNELRKKKSTVVNADLAATTTSASLVGEFSLVYDHSRGERRNWIDCEENRRVKDAADAGVSEDNGNDTVNAYNDNDPNNMFEQTPI